MARYTRAPTVQLMRVSEKQHGNEVESYDILLGVNAEVSPRTGSGVPTPPEARFPSRVLRFARTPSDRVSCGVFDVARHFRFLAACQTESGNDE